MRPFPITLRRRKKTCRNPLTMRSFLMQLPFQIHTLEASSDSEKAAWIPALRW
jgi:hypothetical protein